MKSLKFFLFTSVVLTHIVACKHPKQNVVPTESKDTTSIPGNPVDTFNYNHLKWLELPDFLEQLDGEWSLLLSEGGWNGDDTISYTDVFCVFSEHILIRTEQGIAENIPCQWIKIDNSSTYSGLYMLGLKGNPFGQVFKYIKNDTLHTGDFGTDGYHHIYFKVK